MKKIFKIVKKQLCNLYTNTHNPVHSCGVCNINPATALGFFISSGETNVIKIDIRHNILEAAGQLAKLKNELQNKAIGAALNKTADKAKAEMTRQVTAEFNIKAGDVRPQMRVKYDRAQGYLQVATLQAFGRRGGRRSRNVMLFQARTVPGKGKKRVVVQMPDGKWVSLMVPVGGGVSVKIKRNGARKLIPGAFIGN